jgi:hypothetical protein
MESEVDYSRTMDLTKRISELERADRDRQLQLQSVKEENQLLSKTIIELKTLLVSLSGQVNKISPPSSTPWASLSPHQHHAMPAQPPTTNQQPTRKPVPMPSGPSQTFVVTPPTSNTHQAAPPQPIPLPPATPWKDVAKRGKPAPKQTPTEKTKTSPLKKVLTKTSSPEEVLESLVEPVRPTPRISMILVHLSLNGKARKQPMMAWKAALTAILGEPPLLISFTKNRCVAEIYVDLNVTKPESLEKLQKFAPPKDYATSIEDEMSIRSRAYLKGYFKALRLSTFQGFNLHQQIDILRMAKEIISREGSSVTPDSSKRWLQTISWDMRSIQEQIMEADKDLEML